MSTYTVLPPADPPIDPLALAEFLGADGADDEETAFLQAALLAEQDIYHQSAMRGVRAERPWLVYLGGKFRYRHFLAHLLPYASGDGLYVEPFAGALSVLMARRRSAGEVVNDIDGQLVRAVRALADPVKFKAILLRASAPSRQADVVRRAAAVAWGREPALDEIDAVVCFLRSLAFGFAGRPAKLTSTGAPQYLRSFLLRSNAKARAAPLATLAAAAMRLRAVEIEHMDALAFVRGFLERHTATPLVLYCDPPYLSEVSEQPRSAASSELFGGYATAFTEAQHRALLDLLLRADTWACAVSSYRNALYDATLTPAGWRCVCKPVRGGCAFKVGSSPRWVEEAVYVNATLVQAHGGPEALAALAAQYGWRLV